MHTKSDGSLAAVDLSLRAGVAVAFLATVAACPGPTPRSVTGVAGGGGTTSSSGGTTSSGCTFASDCPVPTSPCQRAACDDGACGFEQVEPGTPCTGNNGKVCDQAGQCVACVGPEHCPADPPCDGDTYHAPPTCEDGACVSGAIIGCSPPTKKCHPQSGCVGCLGPADCLPTASAASSCVIAQCIDHACSKSFAPLGRTCSETTGEGTCGGDGVCHPAAKFVFVTKDTFTPDFGGTAGADEQCTLAAEAAGFEGTWMSWTSDNQSQPGDRFTITNATSYLRLDGQKVAKDWSSLIDGSIAAGIDLDEDNVPHTGDDVWTGTGWCGDDKGISCGNWTNTTGKAVYGTAGDTSSTWSIHGSHKACGGKGRLYCFQQ